MVDLLTFSLPALEHRKYQYGSALIGHVSLVWTRYCIAVSCS